MPSAAPKLNIASLKDLYDIGEIPPLGHVPEKMHAWVIRKERHGPPDKSFQIEVVPTWTIGEDEVLLMVMAGGVNYNGVWAGRGKPISVMRMTGKDFHIAGSDASGIVWKVGENVKHWRPGDEVILHCNQSCDTYCGQCAGYDPMMCQSQKIWGYETPYGSFAQFTKVQAQQLLHVNGCSGRTQCRNRIIDTILGQCHYIHIAFHYEYAMACTNGFLRLIQTVKLVPFFKQPRFGRIQILGLSLVQYSTTKTDHLAALVDDGKHDAVAETVIALAVVILEHVEGRLRSVHYDRVPLLIRQLHEVARHASCGALLLLTRYPRARFVAQVLDFVGGRSDHIPNRINVWHFSLVKFIYFYRIFLDLYPQFFQSDVFHITQNPDSHQGNIALDLLFFTIAGESNFYSLLGLFQIFHPGAGIEFYSLFLEGALQLSGYLFIFNG